MMRDGEIAPIASCETGSELDPELGAQRAFSARATDARGRATTLTGRALEVRRCASAATGCSPT